MTTDRSYRSGMTHERALAILIEYAGKQFDPRIVDIFLSLTQESIATGLASGAFTGEWQEDELVVAG
jgi:HD-GYP domain-containing protein (c-di-GMP phosphodiesterase class II)